jgi:hypothetical protein
MSLLHNKMLLTNANICLDKDIERYEGVFVFSG